MPSNAEPSVFGIPDRSGITRNTSKTEDSEDIDIGWADGTLSDGRSYRAECWATDQITLLTFFFSTAQIEAYTDAQFIQLLEDEGLIEFFGDSEYVTGQTFEDPSGNEMWSINIVIGDADNEFAKDSVTLQSF